MCLLLISAVDLECGTDVVNAPPVADLDRHCPRMPLHSSQQPLWWCDTRLGKVVPPPWFFFPLYSSFNYIWITVALKLMVGVKSLPCVH